MAVGEQAEGERFQPLWPATKFGDVGTEAVVVTMIDRGSSFVQHGGSSCAEQMSIEPERIKKDKLPVEGRAVLSQPALC